MVAEVGLEKGGASGETLDAVPERFRNLTVARMGWNEWQPIRRVYEAGGERVVDICARFGVSKSSMRQAAIAFEWRLRHPRVIDRTDVIERLFRLLDRQVRDLENDMAKAGPNETAVLGRLVNSLDKLIAIRDAHSAKRHPTRTTREISDIKAKLIARIEQLKRN